MKNFKFKSLLLSFILIFSALTIFFTQFDSAKKQEEYSASASSFETKKTKFTSKETQSFNVQDLQYTEEKEGNIPFLIYTDTSSSDEVYSYWAQYEESTTTDTTDSSTAKEIYHYTIKEETIPYIMLASEPKYEILDKKITDEINSKKNNTLYFKFNFDSITDVSIPSTGYLSAEATINGTPIVADITPTATTNNYTYLFAVNLLPLSNGDAQCPNLLNEESHLGGEGEKNDVSFRTGLYEFRIRYSYKDNASFNVSNVCIFETAFYVLDYTSYVEKANPVYFENADNYKYEKTVSGLTEEVSSDYYVFNYNYTHSPIVYLDATKFAFNFLYTTSYLNYNFKYSNFSSIYSKYVIDSVPNGDLTGNITVKLDDSNLTYTIPTYKTVKINSKYDTTETGVSNPFIDDNFDIFKDSNSKFNYKNDGSSLVWVDENNNGILDSGDWFYIENGTINGYNPGVDYLWEDSNNDGMLDKNDKFYLDTNNNKTLDKEEQDLDNDGEFETINYLEENTTKTYSLTFIETIAFSYYAKFDLQDFEKNFLIPNKINSTFLGTYSFGLDFLIENSLGGYSVFDSAYVPEAPNTVTSQKLVAFGYNLKYYDQDPSSSTYHQNVELVNDFTWANWIAYNSTTQNNNLIDTTAFSNENGKMKNIPEAIAITNQAPLRFDYFGNLNQQNFSSLFMTYDYKTTSEQNIINYFANISNINSSDLSIRDINYFNSPLTSPIRWEDATTYYQGAAISSDGIMIFELDYSINIVVDSSQKQINGRQYMVFEINNTIQNLYIQAIDFDGNGNATKSYDFNKYTNKDVRVNIEYKNNTFFAPVTVSYSYYKNYSYSSTPVTGTLKLKTKNVTQNGNTIKENVTYSINNKTYNYFVTNNDRAYTFSSSASGAYKIVIKNAISNVPVTYYFTIDNEPFSGISTNKASLSGYEYVIDKKITSQDLTNKTQLNEYDLIISDQAITMGWNNKKSGANSYSYVYYMELQNDLSLENTLFEIEGEFWLTNGYKLNTPSGAIDTFVNYKDQTDYLNKYLNPKSYFNKEGLYIFYVYDEAGNFFTRSILIDNTLGRVLQGYWKEDTLTNTNVWHDTFDPMNNDANYVNVDTTLYFGTHKAIALPDMSQNDENSVAQFDDISYIRAYDLSESGNGVLISTKAPKEIYLYRDILNMYKSFVKGKDSTINPLIAGNDFNIETSPNYYLTLENTLNSYTRVYEDGEDESGAPVAVEDRGVISEIYFSKIYKSLISAMNDVENEETALKYPFYGEAQYNYVVTNLNGLKFSKNIEMNFDIVKGTFYGYNRAENETVTERLIRKNSGTNLDVLKFVYDNIEGETAAYYSLSELTFTYYEFVLDESSENSSHTSYPFSKNPSKTESILEYSNPIENGKKYSINGINLNASGKTQPGKYIITRTYVGGDYNYVDGRYVQTNTGTGGSFYKNSNGEFINLFEDDTLVRKYVVYVDHYGIISTEYMTRNDSKKNVREVGNFISLTLNNTFSDEWEFKEFFLTSSASLSLNTNKVPVKINIPLSKFFVYYYSSTNNLYAKQSFAKLNIVISYQASPTTAWQRYVIDGFDFNGLCTCSDLSNNGQLIFSAAGSYVIYIEDCTGYSDNTSYLENANNIDPTTFEYSFTISHNAPEATVQIKTFNYDENKFNAQQNLSNIYDNKILATNIKEENYVTVGTISKNVFESNFYYIDANGTPAEENTYDSSTTYYIKNESGAYSQIDTVSKEDFDNSFKKYYVYNGTSYTPASPIFSPTSAYYFKKDNNELLLSWADPITPYEAKIKQITIKTSYMESNKLVDKTYVLDLISTTEEGFLIYNLIELNDTNREKIYYFDKYEFIKYFKIGFYNNISSSSTFDHREYYRYSYILSLSLHDEYKYQITISYISDSNTNQSYEDEKGNSYADSLYTINIDRTKPNTNINLLLSAETYLTSSGYYSSSNINNFKEENFEVSSETLETTPSAFTYAFPVADNFALNYNSNDTMPYFFVRHYNKYDLNPSVPGSAYSSITPDMIDSVYNEDKCYYNINLSTKFTKYYPRFSEIDTYNNIITLGDDIRYRDTWYKINYQANASLRSQIISATNDSNPRGFYEIIERDLAGNYRCYTVYFNEYNSVFLNLSVDGYTQKDSAVYLISTGDDALKDNISATVEIELTDISSRLGWGTLTIRNETAGTEYGSIKLTPFDVDKTAVLAEINNYLKTALDSKFSFKLDTYNSFYKTTQLSRYINFDVDGEGRLERPNIRENYADGKYTYSIILPVYDNIRILYLEEFTLNSIKVVNSRLVETTLFSSSSKESLREYLSTNYNSIDTISGLEKGIYRVIFKDNFNANEYHYILHVGEFYLDKFDDQYFFEFGAYKKTYDRDLEKDLYYSGGEVYVTYESNIYNVYVNNVLYSNTENETLSTKFNECKTFTLSPSIIYSNVEASSYVGGYDTYIIEYRDKIDDSIGKTTLYIRIYNVLPEIILTNAYGGDVVSTLEESDTQIINSVVNMNWGYLTFNNDIFNYVSLDEFNSTNTASDDRNLIIEKDIITATLYKKNNYGDYVVNIINPNREQVVTDEGYYKLVITNTLLNNSREIYFAISFTDVPLYSIYANSERIYASPYEEFDLTDSRDDIINRLHLAIDGSNKIILSDAEKASIYKQLGFTAINDTTMVFNKNNIGIVNLTNVPHFYSIYTPKVVYNSNMDINVIEISFRNNILQSEYAESVSEFDDTTGLSINNPLLKISNSTDYWTTIFLVYNLDGPIRIEFFAFTKVPRQTSLLSSQIKFYNEDKDDTRPINNRVDTINLDLNEKTYTLTNKQIQDSNIILLWSKTINSTTTWYNQGNCVIAYDQYGFSNYSHELDCSITNEDDYFYVQGTIYAILTGSGVHKLTFKDVAGNTHQFAANSYYPQNYYTLNLIDSVIYHINVNNLDYNPIQHGVFNDPVNLVIDEEFISYYSNLKVDVIKNGISYKSSEFLLYGDYTYTFSDPGKYVVTLSAYYGQQKENKLLDVVYNFNIVSPSSARLAYEFVEINGYEILEVIRSGQNITNSFVDNTGKITSLFISASNSKSGNGYYKIKLKYGKNDEDVLSYAFLINDFVPTISCNVKHGETTTSNIVISYNPSIIYEQLGDCYIKILTYNNDSKTFNSSPTRIAINANSFNNSLAKEFQITRSNSYFIQVETANGNVLTSFRVNKKDPLNTIAIIILVVAAIVVMVVVIIIIKLRTRMKIK